MNLEKRKKDRNIYSKNISIKNLTFCDLSPSEKWLLANYIISLNKITWKAIDYFKLTNEEKNEYIKSIGFQSIIKDIRKLEDNNGTIPFFKSFSFLTLYYIIKNPWKFAKFNWKFLLFWFLIIMIVEYFLIF